MTVFLYILYVPEISSTDRPTTFMDDHVTDQWSFTTLYISDDSYPLSGGCLVQIGRYNIML